MKNELKELKLYVIATAIENCRNIANFTGDQLPKHYSDEMIENIRLAAHRSFALNYDLIRPLIEDVKNDLSQESLRYIALMKEAYNAHIIDIPCSCTDCKRIF